MSLRAASDPDIRMNEKRAASTASLASGLPISPLPEVDSKQAWLVVLGAFFGFMFSNGLTITYGVYMEDYKVNEFPDTSASFLSWIGSIQAATPCFLGVGVSELCTHYDTRHLCMVGALTTGVSFMAASFCTTPVSLLLTQGVLAGIGISLFYNISFILPVQWFKKYRSVATSIAISGSGVCGLWLTIATRKMMDTVGRQWAMRITGFIIAGVCLPASLLMRTRTTIHGPPRFIDVQLLKDRRIILIMLLTAFGNAGYHTPYQYINTYSVIALGKSDTWGANLSSIMIAASVLGRIAIGALGDIVGPLNTMIFTTAASCVSVFALWLPFTSTSMAIAFSVIFGFFSGIIAGLPPVITSRIFGSERMPSIIGLVMFAGGCGFLAATPSSGALLSRFGNGADFDSMIIFTGLVLAVSIICQLSLRVAVSKRLFEKM